MSSRDSTLRVDGLGAVSFPNSGMAEAQEPFLRGVLLLHAFRWDDAAAEFRHAQAADPSFALAYWGEAMTYDRPVAGDRFRAAGLHALSGLAPTPEQRRARASTERERDWLYAAEMLFGPQDSAEGSASYLAAMKAIVEKYPDDVEARLFLALARLTSVASADTAAALVTELDSIRLSHPEHMGAAHYLVLAYDRPELVGRGLDAALVYQAAGPESSEALHTISQVMFANGAWTQGVQVAERALGLQRARLLAAGRPPAVCDEYSALLHYGYLMVGLVEDAATMLESCQERVRGGTAIPSEVGFYVSMRARQILDSQDWTSAQSRWTADVGQAAWTRLPYDFVTAFALLRSGDARRAATFTGPLQRLGRSADVSAQDLLLLNLLANALLLEHGRTEEALEGLRAAVAAEDALAPGLVLPGVLLPTRELLADALTRAGKAAEATEVLTEALARSPGRTPIQDALAAPR